MTNLALEVSITHWERNAAATTLADIKIGKNQCALCQEYYNNDCKDCPVMQRTNMSYCAGTPFDDCYLTYNRLRAYSLLPGVDTQQVWEKWLAAANREVEFLKSLRTPT